LILLEFKPRFLVNPQTLKILFLRKKNTSVIELAKIIHKDLVKNFKYARLWRHTESKPLIVGRDHILQDKDIIEIHD